MGSAQFLGAIGRGAAGLASAPRYYLRKVPLRGSARSRPQGVSPVFRTALRCVCADQGALHSRCAPFQALGDSPPLAVATPAGVGLGQGVVV
jgi:hypothetical protein